MVSPVHGDYRRCQAETPLIVLFRFPEPALIVVPLVRLRSCGVARSTSSALQISAIARLRPLLAIDLAPRELAKTNPVLSISAIMSCAGFDNQTRLVAAFLVPSQPKAGTGFPGNVHQPSSICSVRMCMTSPGRWPVNKIIFKIELRISPASSNALQNNGTSLSDRTRSRSVVWLRSTPTQGLILTLANSFLSAHEKIAEAAARV